MPNRGVAYLIVSHVYYNRDVAFRKSAKQSVKTAQGLREGGREGGGIYSKYICYLAYLISSSMLGSH
jgi:hypothetical protein